MTPIPLADDREMVVDALPIAVMSVAIISVSHQTQLMTWLIAAVVLARFVAWRAVVNATGKRLAAELLFFAGCTLVGGFNDWNSVTNHQIYRYDVPSAASWTDIPVWMLLYWGLILRFVATLCRWQRLSPPLAIDNTVCLGNRSIESAALRLAVLAAMVIVTRQLIYRLYEHPWWSWLPFACALVGAAVVLRPKAHDRAIVFLFIAGGPLIEMLYINLGDLHRYHLGWLGGVPVWIVLWWGLSVLIWKDLSARALAWLSPRFVAGRT